MARPQVIAVTGPACTAATVRRLAASGAVVILWTTDAGRAGELAALVVAAGGRAATFCAPPTARETLETFAEEQFGGLDEVVEAP